MPVEDDGGALGLPSSPSEQPFPEQARLLIGVLAFGGALALAEDAPPTSRSELRAGALDEGRAAVAGRAAEVNVRRHAVLEEPRLAEEHNVLPRIDSAGISEVFAERLGKAARAFYAPPMLWKHVSTNFIIT